MKKHYIVLITIALSIFALSSCQKVIEMDLNTSSPAIVIHGNVYNHAGPYVVRISKTVNFDAPNDFPAVTNAIVTINDNAGNSERLIEKSDGLYYTSTLLGFPGLTYTLTVETDGKTYTATSTMPEPVNIDSIYFKKSLFGGESLATIDFKDPSNIDNYYRVIQYINDTIKIDNTLGNDKLSPGQKISYSLSTRRSMNDNPLKTGDKITVQLECIDEAVFEYLRTSRTFSGQSASPANPVSNISNGALGYFNACSIREASITVH